MDLLLNITVPAISENYDVLVPDFMPVSELVPLIANAVEDMSEHRYQSSGAEILCGNGNVFSSQYTLKHYSVANGDHLMLF